jgi:hypothetical protein
VCIVLVIWRSALIIERACRSSLQHPQFTLYLTRHDPYMRRPLCSSLEPFSDLLINGHYTVPGAIGVIPLKNEINLFLGLSKIL